MALYHWIQIPCKLSNRVYIDKHILCATLTCDVELLVNQNKQLGYNIICITNLLLHDKNRADEVLIFNNNVFVPEINANTNDCMNELNMPKLFFDLNITIVSFSTR